MIMKDLKDFIFEIYIWKLLFVKESKKKDVVLFASNLPDLSKAKGHYELFFKNKVKIFPKHQKLRKTQRTKN